MIPRVDSVVPRRTLIIGGGILLAVATGRAARAATVTARLASAPDGLDGVPDYPYWVARDRGYFGDLDAPLDSDTTDAGMALKRVDRGRVDLCACSPGRFALALEQGMRLVSVFQIGASDPFWLAFRKGEAVAWLKPFAGKTLLLDHAARAPFADAWFAQAGMEAGSVTYVEAGADWGQALAAGKGDAALTWDGQRAVWAARGLPFDYLGGAAASRLPGRCLVARARDLSEPTTRALLERYARGWAMALAFAERNPRAAAHIVSRDSPGLAATMPPPVATAALLQVAAGFRGAMDKRKGWGWHDTAGWDLLFGVSRELGQTSLPFAVSDHVSNALIPGANTFDAAQARADADGYTLPPDFALVDVDALRAAP
jgi:NitT/TauT family transport system substrate-binding protein